MKYTNLTKLTPEELTQKLVEEKNTLRKLQFAHTINPLEKTNRLSKTRKLIARIKTIQNTPKKTT